MLQCYMPITCQFGRHHRRSKFPNTSTNQLDETVWLVGSNKRLMNNSPRYAPLEPVEYIERAIGADHTLPDLLLPGSKIRNLTATLGAEVFGVQLSQLSPQGKDQLALLVNEQKVLGMVLSCLLRYIS